ncbi:unnamed protein product [Lactuca saligna]|uniref:Patellin-6 n=1 Tax=Lactuca saligna TaxID=75948 RepID=A0AA36ELI5_LACSI|nr:unnamed protein product [Lactuca saligna]
MDSSSPSPISLPDQKPKKTFVDSLMDSATTPHRTPSFKEDTYHLHNLKPSEKKALQELKDKLTTTSDDDNASMWGIPLLPPTATTEKSDVILLKFLRARDFRVQDSLNMLLKCLSWRKDFGADSIVEEDLGFKELEGLVAYMNGWRVQVLERGIKMLHLRPGGINSIIQVTDLKDMPKRELRVASNHILSLFQDNYPEMVARKIFINVPWYFSMLYSMFSPFLTQRTKSKFVLSKEGNVAETLYNSRLFVCGVNCIQVLYSMYIRPEDVPVQYGGLSRPSDLNNGPPKPASEFTVKGGEKVNIQIEGIEAGATITWDIVVGGWDLEYSAEYVPIANGSYSIAVEKTRKMGPTEEAVHNSYTAKEAGKLVLSVDNSVSRKRKVASYRYLVRKSGAVM